MAVGAGVHVAIAIICGSASTSLRVRIGIRGCIVTVRSRVTPPGEWAVNGVVAIFFANTALNWLATVAKGVAKLIAVETNHVRAGSGNMIRKMAFPACRGLSIMLSAG